MPSPRSKPAAIVPPHNTDAEDHVLGAILANPKALERASQHVRPADFYRDTNALIYATALDMHRHDQPVDAVTLCAELERNSHLDRAGGRPRILELAALPVTASNVAHHARLIRDAARNRELLHAAQQVQAAALNGGLDQHPEALEAITAALNTAPTGDTLQALNLDELLSGPIPETPWLWNGWIAQGDLALIVADGGTGKSLTALALLEAIRHGHPFLDEPTSKAPNVGMVDLENPLPEVKSRLYGLGIRPDHTTGFHYLHAPPLDLSTPGGIALLEDWVVRNHLDVLVLDSFRRLAPGLDENDSAAVSSIFTPLRVLSVKHGTTILVVHHGRKRLQGTEGPDPEPRGSGDFRASVDVLLYLRKKQADTPSFVLSHEKNRHGQPHRSIQVAIVSDDDTGSIQLQNEGAAVFADTAREALQEKVLATLREHGGGPFTMAQLAIRVDRKPKDGTLARAVSELYNAGRLAKGKDGRSVTWALTEDDWATT